MAESNSLGLGFKAGDDNVKKIAEPFLMTTRLTLLFRNYRKIC